MIATFNLPCCGKPVERYLKENTQQQKFFCRPCGAGWDLRMKFPKLGEKPHEKPLKWVGANKVAEDILYYGEQTAA